MQLRRVCVFCGSSRGASPAFAKAARDLGREIARWRLGLVYGGGGSGLMGELADAALEAGAQVTGVIPKALLERESGHSRAELRVVGSMHERKALMADLSDAFVALPGGFGTLEEFCEVITWTQLGLHAKPGLLLDVEGFFEPLVAMFDRASAEGFISPANRALVLCASTPAEALGALAAWEAPPSVPGPGLELS
jgi:uncharacterized protein (TIGR00730 family)